MSTQIFDSVARIPAAQWNALHDGGNPFVTHEFLSTLEFTGCVSPTNGWQGSIVTLWDGAELLAAAPAYAKMHSYGEFVFDFSWAQAYERFGLPYYPKLVVGIPFTPATGLRLLVRPGVDATQLRQRLLAAMTEHVQARQLSSAHLLFAEKVDIEAAQAGQWLIREDCQFHWQNDGYRDFEHFLESFTSEKRKKARRERRRVAEAGIQFETRHGHDVSSDDLATVYRLIQRTFRLRRMEPYITAQFLPTIAALLGSGLMLQLARRDGELVAAAVFFRGRQRLFGRYWGGAEDIHSLHFEACYYRGIDYCIEHGLQHFDPGVQGEHKIARGFAPAITRSAHYIADARFRHAIGEFIERETRAVADYARQVDAHLPYRK